MLNSDYNWFNYYSSQMSWYRLASSTFRKGYKHHNVGWGTAEVVECSLNHVWGPGFNPQRHINQASWCVPVIPTPWRWRQRNQKCKVLFGFVTNLRSAWASWATWNLISKLQNSKRKWSYNEFIFDLKRESRIIKSTYYTQIKFKIRIPQLEKID